jgi:hypothetical protein
VIPDGNDVSFSKLLDLNMLVMNGGRERTTTEFRELFDAAGLTFSTFGDAAQEATLSRIFAGQHFRFDLTAGQRLGREVADVVVDGLLTHRLGPDDFDNR